MSIYLNVCSLVVNVQVEVKSTIWNDDLTGCDSFSTWKIGVR